MTTTTTSPIGACTLTTVYDANGYPVSQCIDCPEIPAVEAVPAQTLTDARLGWNASARSAIERSGDCYTQFSVPAHVAGVVCGLTPAHVSSDPRDVSHAVYVYQDGGRELWRITEAGVPVTAPVLRAPDTDEFRIERRCHTVRYFHNSAQVHVSAVPLAGPVRVVACLYSAGDGVN